MNYLEVYDLPSPVVMSWGGKKKGFCPSHVKHTIVTLEVPKTFLNFAGTFSETLSSVQSIVAISIQIALKCFF